jgi:putative ABC transport system substrate-binding protein
MDRLATAAHGLSRRRFLQGSAALAGLALVSGCSRLPMRAQPPKVRRIGFLAVELRQYHEALFQGLRDHGYVEGQTIAVERRSADGRLDRLPGLAAELVSLPVDVLVSAAGATVAARATNTIPIVVLQNDAVEQGFVASLARPGGNLTGIDLPYTALTTKRLEILKDAFPSISRVAVLENGPFTGTQARAADAVASTLGLTLRHYDLQSIDDFASVFEAVRANRAEALIALAAPVLATNRSQIFAFASQQRMPAIYSDRAWADDGGLMAYGANFADMFRRLAVYVHKILQGAKPGEIPMEGPTVFDFVVNQKTAQALGLTVPDALLQQATELIQ